MVNPANLIEEHAERIVRLWDYCLRHQAKLHEEHGESHSDVEMWGELIVGIAEWRSLYQALNGEFASHLARREVLSALRARIQDEAKSILRRQVELKVINPDLVLRLKDIRSFHQFEGHPNDCDQFMLDLNMLWEHCGFAGKLKIEMKLSGNSPIGPLSAISDAGFDLSSLDTESKNTFFTRVKRLREKHAVYGQFIIQGTRC